LSPRDFIERFEKTSTPLIIEGIPRAEGWAAVDMWSATELLSNEQLSKYTFKCGEDDDGRSVRVRLKHFFK
jgi:histone arginine demethylase JMJD6